MTNQHEFLQNGQKSISRNWNSKIEDDMTPQIHIVEVPADARDFIQEGPDFISYMTGSKERIILKEGNWTFLGCYFPASGALDFYVVPDWFEIETKDAQNDSLSAYNKMQDLIESKIQEQGLVGNKFAVLIEKR